MLTAKLRRQCTYTARRICPPKREDIVRDVNGDKRSGIYFEEKDGVEIVRFHDPPLAHRLRSQMSVEHCISTCMLENLQGLYC